MFWCQSQWRRRQCERGWQQQRRSRDPRRGRRRSRRFAHQRRRRWNACGFCVRRIVKRVCVLRKEKHAPTPNKNVQYSAECPSKKNIYCVCTTYTTFGSGPLVVLVRIRLTQRCQFLIFRTPTNNPITHRIKMHHFEAQAVATSKIFKKKKKNGTYVALFPQPLHDVPARYMYNVAYRYYSVVH